MTKKLLKYVMAGLLLVAAGKLLAVALALMDRASDVAFFGGVGLLSLLIGILVIGGGRMLGYMRKNRTALTRLFMLFIAASGFTVLSGCSRIGPGHVGIKVDMAGTSRGVEGLPIRTGWVFYLPGGSQVLEYPTFVQTAVWTSKEDEGQAGNQELSFYSQDGTLFTADVSLSYQLEPDKVPQFYVKFRSDNLDDFTHGYLKNIVRNALNTVASHYTVDQVYGDRKQEILDKAKAEIEAQVQSIGVDIGPFGFTGGPRPPQNVVEAINAKIRTTQQALQAENQVAVAKAQADQSIAAAQGDAQAKRIRAEGEAQANLALARSITPALIEWRRLEIANKWNGQLPQVDGSGKSALLLQLPSDK